jgi:hypothetical protein
MGGSHNGGPHPACSACFPELTVWSPRLFGLPVLPTVVTGLVISILKVPPTMPRILSFPTRPSRPPQPPESSAHTAAHLVISDAPCLSFQVHPARHAIPCRALCQFWPALIVISGPSGPSRPPRSGPPTSPAPWPSLPARRRCTTRLFPRLGASDPERPASRQALGSTTSVEPLVGRLGRRTTTDGLTTGGAVAVVLASSAMEPGGGAGGTGGGQVGQAHNHRWFDHRWRRGCRSSFVGHGHGARRWGWGERAGNCVCEKD